VTPANFIGIPNGQRSNIYQTQLLATITPEWMLRVAGGFTHSPNEWFVSPAANATLSSGGGSYTNTSQRGIYANVQATRSTGGQTLIAGMETRADKARTGGQPIPNYAIRENGSAFDTQAFGKTLNHAGYVQYQRNVLEKLNIVAGARADYWKTYDGGSQAGTGLAITNQKNRSNNAVTGKIAAAYTLPGNWQLRGSIGSAFRNPTIYEMYRDFLFFGSFLLGNPDAKPERLLAYEGGINHTFSSDHSFSLSVFENRISDLIYRTTDLSDPTGRTRRLTNAALARTRGAEIAVRQQITPWLQFREFYTYTNTVITKNPGVPETVGKRSPYLPRNTVGYSATFTHKRLASSWNGRYVSAMYSSGTNTDVTKGVPGGYDPFFEMGLSATVKLNRNFSAVFNADNLLDRQYHLYYLAQGRTVFGGLRLHY
jgi:iron complex outermembrane receptor protein